jgi:hypothetical protein
MKNLHFLSGLPRSGSTVLAAILNQNPNTHVSTTSGLVHALDGLANTWAQAPLLNENDPQRDGLAKTMLGTIEAFYADVAAPVIIDKSRGWPIPIILHAMRKVLGREPKIIATVRSIPDCAASFVRVARPNNLDDFIHTGQLMDHLKAAYQSLEEGYRYAPDNFLFVEYEDLIADPKTQLARVHDFLGLPPYAYNFDEIDGASVKEDDENLHGYAGMHDIKPKLAKQHDQNPKDILKHHYSSFCQPEFWLPEPRTVPEIHDLDLQLAAATVGDFDEGWRIAQKLLRETPEDHRAAYNAGWYFLRQGDIRRGYELMERGRGAGMFGENRPDAPTPQWDGRSRGIILLNLEHGLGDQIHQARYAKDIAARGNKVIISCVGQLASLFIDVEGVSAVIQREASFGIYHDAWVPGMSAPLFLGLELRDLRGDAYIRKPMAIKGKRKRIGLRWQGNSRFEQDHHKKFPYDLMFDAIKDADAEFISLQRDEGVEACPPWVRQVPLDSWEDTRMAVASCDLVISACTSVSHLAAAMGVETWVITPVMPYYLYAIDGPTTPYYNTMRLFRQEVFGNWEAPFARIKEALDVRKDQQLRLVG